MTPLKSPKVSKIEFFRIFSYLSFFVAYFGLGTGYLSSFDYENALRYLNMAKSNYEYLGNIPRCCGVLRTLSDCYSRLNKQVQSLECKGQSDKLEDELRDKLSTINFKLDDLRDR